MDADPGLALELAVCSHYRIPHSEFLSWSPDDRDKAIWQHIRERQACQACGTRPDEWDEERGGHRYAYAAEPKRCRGCELIEAARGSVTDKDGRGIRIVLVPNRGDGEVTDGQS